MMARSAHYKGNDEGGYGNPPVSHQFTGKPGPGRPKGSKSIDGALRKTFSKKVVRVDKNGKRSFINAPEALAERALELGLKGPLVANVEARKLAESHGPQDNEIKIDLSKFTDAELQMYGYLANKMFGLESDQDQTLQETRILKRVGEIIEEEAKLAAEERWRKKIKPAASRMIEKLRNEDSDEQD